MISYRSSKLAHASRTPCPAAARREGRRTQQGYSPGSRRRAPHRLAGAAAILTVARSVTRQLIYQVSSALCCRREWMGAAHIYCLLISVPIPPVPLWFAKHNLFRDIVPTTRCQININIVLPPLNIIQFYDFKTYKFCAASVFNFHLQKTQLGTT